MMVLALRSCLRPRIGRSRAFSRPWVGLNVIVCVLRGVMPGGWDHFVEHDWVSCRLVGGHLLGPDHGGLDGLPEEPPGRPRVTTWGDEHIDDLAELVDREVPGVPPPGDLDVGLINVRAV